MKILSVFTVLIILSLPSYAQDSSASRQTQVLEGNISSVDWVGALITVNNAIIYVPLETIIYKGDTPIGLDDINMGDAVTVTYYDDPPGIHKAVSIVVQYNGDFAV